MQLKNRIETFCVLGNNLESFIKDYHKGSFSLAQQKLADLLRLAEAKNAWFTISNQLLALGEWAKALKKENINQWLSNYKLSIKNKNIGIIAAGNIPLVGFHDLLSVVLSGNNAIIKLSANDEVLMRYMIDFLYEIAPELKDIIKVVDTLKNYDAVIATGSDNTARYFEAYFKEKPHIIRRNRTSVAVLLGNESNEDLVKLNQDIFSYFGLGCRNVTKIYIPQGYSLDNLFKYFYEYKDIINHHKYANNYDYYKAIFLMKKIKFTENGFLILKEDKNLFSPISVINYERYNNIESVSRDFISLKENIQCIVSKTAIRHCKTIDFGTAQLPKLWDYADGLDTIEWLNEI